MLRYKTETRPGLVALYDIQPGNLLIKSTGVMRSALNSNLEQLLDNLLCIG